MIEIKNFQEIYSSPTFSHPFQIPRLGWCETKFWLAYRKNNFQILSGPNQYNLNIFFHQLQFNAGLYTRPTTSDSIEKLYEIYYQKIQDILSSAKYLAVFDGVPFLEQEYIHIKKEHPHLIFINATRTLEPFKHLSPSENIMSNNWIKDCTHHKKVLIVSPFVKSFEKQLVNHPVIKSFGFSDTCEFVWYQSYFTSADNKLHTNWLETFNKMYNEICWLDFDIAFMGCGGYGVLLCDRIHKEMNKSAIYIGGALQLFFGVIGKRWKERKDFMDKFKEYGIEEMLISPEERFESDNKIEGGCYW